MPPPPVRVTRPVLLPTKLLTVEYADEAWTDDATELVKKLLELDGIAGARVGEKGKITLTLEASAEPDEAQIKKLIKEAGMTFKALLKE
jgi:hypothetical protein